jgi:hypothetical protein
LYLYGAQLQSITNNNRYAHRGQRYRIIFMADEFCKSFDRMMAKYTLKSENKRPYHRDNIKFA